MSGLKIGAYNLLDYVSSVTWTTGTENATYPFANLHDDNVYDFCQFDDSASTYQVDPTLDQARKADYFAFYKHNLSDLGGSIKFQYHDGSGWVDAFRNGITYSETFASGWIANASPTLTQNEILSYDGLHYADTITAAGGSTATGYYIFPAVENNTQYEIEIDAFYISGTGGWLIGSDQAEWGAGSTTATVLFDPSTNTISSATAGIDEASSLDLGGGWYRLTLKATTNSSASPASSFVVFSGTTDAKEAAFTRMSIKPVGGYGYCRTNGAANTYYPENNNPWYIEFPQVEYDDYRIEVNNQNAGDAYIGDLRFGERITTAYGIYIGSDVPNFARNTQYKQNDSDSGLPLGRAIRRQGVMTTLNIEHMTDSFVRRTWMDFVKHAEIKPFYVAWNYTKYPSETIYAVSDGPIGIPRHSSYGFQSVNFKITGFAE